MNSIISIQKNYCASTMWDKPCNTIRRNGPHQENGYETNITHLECNKRVNLLKLSVYFCVGGKQVNKVSLKLL